MSELSGQNKESEALRSKIKDVLGVADPSLRKSIIKDLFAEEFNDTLSPEFQQALQGLPIFDDIAPAAVSEKETPEQKAERLLRNVVRAEFDSFQEYSYVSIRSGKALISTKGEDEIRRDSGGVYEGYGNYELNREDDIVPYPKDLLDRQMRARPSLIPISVARLIDPKLVKESWGQPAIEWGELYCVVGRKQGRVVIQGGTKQHTDIAGRPNKSSFKIVFDSEEAGNEYINWLVADPKDAYGPMLRRATASYDKQGNFRQSLIPPPAERGGQGFHDPFSNTPSQVIVKDWRHQPEPLVLKSK